MCVNSHSICTTLSCLSLEDICFWLMFARFAKTIQPRKLILALLSDADCAGLLGGWFFSLRKSLGPQKPTLRKHSTSRCCPHCVTWDEKIISIDSMADRITTTYSVVVPCKYDTPIVPVNRLHRREFRGWMRPLPQKSSQIHFSPELTPRHNEYVASTEKTTTYFKMMHSIS